MKKAIIAMMFFMFISTNSFASDIFGYWKSNDESASTNEKVIFLSEKKCQFGKVFCTNIKTIHDKDTTIIYFVNNADNISEKEIFTLQNMPQDQLDITAAKISIKNNKDSITVTYFNGTRKYIRINEEEGRKALEIK